MGIVVVAGLSPGVGKTTAAAAIASVLSARKRTVAACSLSWQESHAALREIERLGDARGVKLSLADNPYASIQRLAQEYDSVVLEGGPGLSTPVVADDTLADVAAKLQAPMVVVSGNAPGAVTLAVQAVRFAHACGADVQGVVGGRLPRHADLETRLMLMEVSDYTGVPFLGSLPDGIGKLSCERFQALMATVALPHGW